MPENVTCVAVTVIFASVCREAETTAKRGVYCPMHHNHNTAPGRKKTAATITPVQ